MKIQIIVGDFSIDAELNNSPTAAKIANVLPINTSFNTWGDEIYFEIPVDAPLEDNAVEEVELGDLGYWPTGRAFCIFFGPTPMSGENNIVAASAVNIVGRILGDTKQFKTIMRERQIRIEAK